MVPLIYAVAQPIGNCRRMEDKTLPWRPCCDVWWELLEVGRTDGAVLGLPNDG